MKPTAYSPRLAFVHGLRSAAAFTLIEVLVAMTVLSVMVLMAANIFQSSSASWNIGTQKADMNTAARAALDFMARELASAVAGPIDKAASGGATNLQFVQATTNDIRFLALTQDPNAANSARALRGVFFWQANQTLLVLWKTNSLDLDCYSALPNWHGGGTPASGNMLITNVISLEFFVYANEDDLASGIPPIAGTYNQLPLCVDIALEMMSGDDMRRYNEAATDKPSFRARNAKLYSTRVYLPNRQGYGGR